MISRVPFVFMAQFSPSVWALDAFQMIAFFFFFFFFGLQDSCSFPSSKRAFGTPDEPEVRRNNGLGCMQQAFSPLQTKRFVTMTTSHACNAGVPAQIRFVWRLHVKAPSCEG